MASELIEAALAMADAYEAWRSSPSTEHECVGLPCTTCHAEDEEFERREQVVCDALEAYRAARSKEIHSG